MLKIRISRSSEAPEIIQIWKNSVDATHDFLTADDRQEIEKEVIGFFSETPVWVATNQEDRPLGFMFLHDGHLEALFIDASARGLGIGKQLISHALALYPNLSVDVPSVFISIWAFKYLDVRSWIIKEERTHYCI